MANTDVASPAIINYSLTVNGNGAAMQRANSVLPTACGFGSMKFKNSKQLVNGSGDGDGTASWPSSVVPTAFGPTKPSINTQYPDVCVHPMKPLIETITDLVCFTGLHEEKTETNEEGDGGALGEMPEALAITIRKISCEISCKHSESGDGTTALSKTLESYDSETKAVITLAAFAVIYGEFGLMVKHYETKSNRLGHFLAHLKHGPTRLNGVKEHRERFDAIIKQFKAMLDLANCMLQLKVLPSKYINSEIQAMNVALSLLPRAVHLIMQSTIACASTLMDLIGNEQQQNTQSQNDNWRLELYAKPILDTKKLLSEQLHLCVTHIELKKHEERYQTFVSKIEATYSYNTEVLNILINPNGDETPLCEVADNRKVSVKELKNKTVVLLISNLYISKQETSMLREVYENKGNAKYEILWLPVVDSWEDEKFNTTINQMDLWYSVDSSWRCDFVANKYMKERWGFNGNPLLVVLNQQGKVVNTNALHMIRIWGNSAFPFSYEQEKSLLEKQDWSLEFLATTIDTRISKWISKEEHICLYGGKNKTWLSNFTKAANTQERTTKIKLQMLYVGKSNTTGKELQENIDHIKTDGNKHHIPSGDLNEIKFFWTRIESMLQLGLQHGETEVNLLKESKALMTYGDSDNGWAIVFKGSDQWLEQVSGDKLVKALEKPDDWEARFREKGSLLEALNSHFKENKSEKYSHHCRMVVPAAGSNSPDVMECIDCGCIMKKYLMYRCDQD